MSKLSKLKSPINRSIIIGCTALIVVLSLLLSFQTKVAFSDALYEQYDARLRDVISAVERSADADDLRECIRKGESSPKRDELQKMINRFVDDFELAYLYIVIPQDTPDGRMISVISSTSQAEIEAARAAGEPEDDWPILYDLSYEYTRDQVQPYLDAWNTPGISYFEDVWVDGVCYTGCKPLMTSDGEIIALIGADYFIDDVRSTVSSYVIRSVILIVTVCAFFGTLFALWLRRNVTAPIHSLEQSALRFAKMAHEVKDVSELSFDTDEIESSSEVKMLIDAMIKLSQEMKSQVEDAVSAEERATRAERENQQLTEKMEAAIKIAELTQSVTSLLTNMPGLTFSKDVDTRKYLACNQAFAEFAHKYAPEEVVGLTDHEIFDDETADHFVADDNKALAMDQPYVLYEDVLDASGNPRQFQTTKLKFTDATGRLCLLGMSIDFTELMRTKQETLEAKAAYERAQSASAMYSHIAMALSSNYSRLYYVDLDTDEFIEYRSDENSGELAAERQSEDFFNAARTEVADQLYGEDLQPFLAKFSKENIMRALDERGVFSMTYRLLIDSIPTYVSMKITRVQNDNHHIFISVNIEDLDIRNELTGLYTETSFSIRGKEFLAAHPEGWCMVALDLEHFKLFNEWYGRDAGDDLLAQIGAKLVAVEESDGALACYMGQDDFCLLTPYNEESIRKLYAAIHELIMEHGTSVGFMPAFGVCMTDGVNTVEELYDRASLASNHAKENYHTRIRIFDPSMYQQTERDYQILSDFQNALKDEELYIVLQPQCHVSTGKVVGAESLVRWRKKNGEFVSPGVFVPVLEKYGFVTDLDQFVWEQVCLWQRKWIDGGHTPLPVSVNVSQIDIFTIDVPSYFDLLIWKYKLPVDVIKIEITESAYVGDGSVVDTVRRLREKGFLVLMDDFGSGYSSLNMLRNLNVDIIKLDAQFLRMNGSDSKGVHILESIVNMAKTMGVPTIVEGVETKEEADFIAQLGCRYVQGYFFYKPMPVPEFEALIGDPGNIDTGGFVFKARDEFHTREFLDQNVFSDAMLNNILGPVAFFNLHDGELDCIRYNEQFYNEINSRYFESLLKSAQRLVVEDDLPLVYGLLEQAVNDPLGGASDIVRFQREDGSIAQFRVQFFYLDEDENGKRFYGSMHDITQLDRLHSQMRMISRLSNDEVVLIRKRENDFLYQIAVHGLEEALGLSREEFEQELNNGEIRKRISDEDFNRISQALRSADPQASGFQITFIAKDGAGNDVSLELRLNPVQDKSSGVEYLMVLHRADQKE